MQPNEITPLDAAEAPLYHPAPAVNADYVWLVRYTTAPLNGDWP